MEANDILKRQAQIVIERSDDVEGNLGKDAIKLAKKILNGTAIKKDLTRFASLREFIAVSCM